MDLKELKKNIPYQWRVQSYSKNKATATCVAYIDARDVMELLDEVCGPDNWQSDFKEVSGQIYGGVGIFIKSDDLLGGNKWVWKWDTGSESNVEKEKGQASDAFKRAAVKWGIGRFLYDLDVAYAKTNGALSESNKFPFVVDEQGNRVWDLTKHLNGTQKHYGAKPAPPKQVADKRLADEKLEIQKLCDEKALVPLQGREDYKRYIKEVTGLVFGEAKNAEIIERLKAL